ncbi:MAG TPA: PLP-dependent aminotransferase family protein [Candidatus Limnocylindrales bacterium]|nr:PLP-dependent aminotransferase family protein [Candidatus Limnocylindrales bacterium]
MPWQYASRMEVVRPSAIRDLLKHGDDPAIIPFGGGYPDPTLFPMTELRGIYDELLAGPDSSVLQYTVSDGPPRLRQAIVELMAADGVACNVDEVIVLQGAQQGLDLVARMLIDPGDVIVVEDPTFLGAMLAFAPCQPEYATVRLDDDGMDPDDLDRILTATPRAKFLYTMPDFQNPTGVSMSLERRKRVVDIAAKHDVLILEDTPYRLLRFEGPTLPTLKSFDTDGRVIFLGSFSKTLAPGMRIGWAVANPEVTARLGLLKTAADTQSSTLNMAALTLYLERHGLAARVAEITPAYRAKRDLMLDTLAEYFPPSVSYTRPSGGMFTWLTFPEGFDTAAFMRDEALPKAKVAYVPGATFFAREHRINHARFNYSFLADERMVTGLVRLADLLRASAIG